MNLSNRVVWFQQLVEWFISDRLTMHDLPVLKLFHKVLTSAKLKLVSGNGWRTLEATALYYLMDFHFRRPIAAFGRWRPIYVQEPLALLARNPKLALQRDLHYQTLVHEIYEKLRPPASAAQKEIEWFFVPQRNVLDAATSVYPTSSAFNYIVRLKTSALEVQWQRLVSRQVLSHVLPELLRALDGKIWGNLT